MIGHKLAKQLKDAGFPQTEQVLVNYEGEICGRNEDKHDKCDDYDCGLKYVEYPNPNLSQLIEACGDNVGVHKYTEGRVEAWKGGIMPDKMDILAKGETPKEAVVKLWLKLNE